MRRRFHKTFLSPETRHRHSKEWAGAFAEFAKANESGQISGAEFCTRILLRVYRSLFGEHYTNGSRSGFAANEDGLQILSRFKIRQFPEPAALALLRWSAGDIQIELFNRVPSPLEVLEAQARGVRCVSVMIREEDILDFEHEGRDFLSFIIHDLIHAQHFTAHSEAYRQQVQFAGWILKQWNELNSDLGEEPRRELEYLAADMNSHVVHLCKTLRSWIDRHRPGFELLPPPGAAPNLFSDLWNNLNAPSTHPVLMKMWS